MQNTAKHIVDAQSRDGTNVVVSPDGPQVGMINNAFACAAAGDDKTPDMPAFPGRRHVPGATSATSCPQAILNDLKSRDIALDRLHRNDQTVVDEDGPRSQNPPSP